MTLFQSQNVAQARIYGVELSAVARLGAWATALDGWTTQLALAYAKGEDLERDEPLNSVDPASGVLALRYDAPSGRWGGELVTTTVAAKREVDRSRVDLYRTDAYYTLDLLGHVELGQDRLAGARSLQPDRPGLYRVGGRARAPGGRSADPVLHAPGTQRLGDAALADVAGARAARCQRRTQSRQMKSPASFEAGQRCGRTSGPRREDRQ